MPTVRSGRKTRTWLGITAALVFGGAATLLGLGLAGAMPGLQSDGGPSGGTLDGSRLLTSGRDRLAICVQAVGLVSEAVDGTEKAGESAVEVALADFAQNHPDWAGRGLSSPTPVVDIGCPAVPSLHDSQAGPVDGAHLSTVIGRTVTAASYYSVFLYVLPDDEIARVAGSSRLRLTTEERICEVDVCTEVTVGVYLSPREVADTRLLAENLAPAVGLRPAP